MKENFTFINRECLSKNGSDISEDFGIPDYITDIKKIIHCNYILKENNIYQKGDDTVYEGEVVYELLLLCDDDSIRSIAFSSEYSLKTPTDLNEHSNEYDITVENKNTRLLSARKVSLRCRVCVSVFSNTTKDLMPLPDSVTDDEQLFNIERKTMEINNTSTLLFKERGLISSYEIEIPSQLPEIESIIYSSVSPKIHDIKYQENKCIIRGDCYVHILFSASSGEYISITRILDFSDFINTDSNTIKSFTGDITVNEIKISSDSNSFGENRNINIDYTYDIILRATVENKANTVVDMYSTISDTALEFEELEYQTQKDNFITSFSIDYTEAITDNVDNVIDSFSDIENVEITYDKNRSKIIFNGVVYTDIISECEKDNARLDVCHIKIPLSYERDVPDINGELSSDYCIRIVQSDVDIKNNSYDINIEFALMGVIYDRQKETVVGSFSLTQNENSEPSPLVIYYPQEGDDLWSVAKKYRCTCDDIIAVNNLDSNNISDSKVLLIPKSCKRKIFDKVI